MIAAASRFEESRRAAIERFQRVLQDPRHAEERFVAEVLRANAATVFGREHGFDKVRTLDDFRRAVPIRDYDALESWLERAAAGEPAVLTQESPLGFRRTSGTTKESKKIPITRRVLDPEFPAWAACMGAAFDLAPALRTSDSDRVLNVTLNPRGRPTVLPTGALWQSYSEHFARLAGPGDPLYGLPGTQAPWYDSLEVMPPEELAYRRLRLAATSDLLGMIALTPSTVVAFNHVLRQHLPKVIQEVRDGTLFGRRHGSPDVLRARELESVLQSEGAQLALRHIWPNLRFLITWKAGPGAALLPHALDLLGDAVQAVPFLYCGSEGEYSFVVGNEELLVPDNIFYEFVPADEEVAAAGSVLRAHELEPGREYQLVLTAWNGLYRHLNGDILRILGMAHGVPQFEFVGRAGAWSSLANEKMTDRQIIAAVAATSRASNLVFENFTCCPQVGPPGRYVLLVEVDAPVGMIDESRLAAEAERQLCQHNFLYARYRGFGELGPVIARVVPPGTFARYKNVVSQTRAIAVSQVKDKALQKDDAVLKALLGEGLVPSP